MTVRPETIDRFRGDQAAAALVRVEQARGSTPRESGAWMAVGAARHHRHHRRRPARVHGDRRRPGHACPRRRHDDPRHPARPRDRPVLRRPHPALGRPARRRRLGRPAHHRRGRAPRAARGPHLRRRPRRPRPRRGARPPAAAPGPRRQPSRGAAPHAAGRRRGADAAPRGGGAPRPRGRRLRRSHPRSRARLPDRPRGAGARRRRLRRDDRLEDQAGVVPALAQAIGGTGPRYRPARLPDRGGRAAGQTARGDRRLRGRRNNAEHRNLAGANARRPTGTPDNDRHHRAAQGEASSTASSS